MRSKALEVVNKVVGKSHTKEKYTDLSVSSYEDLKASLRQYSFIYPKKVVYADNSIVKFLMKEKSSLDVVNETLLIITLDKSYPVLSELFTACVQFDCFLNSLSSVSIVKDLCRSYDFKVDKGMAFELLQAVNKNLSMLDNVLYQCSLLKKSDLFKDKSLLVLIRSIVSKNSKDAKFDFLSNFIKFDFDSLLQNAVLSDISGFSLSTLSFLEKFLIVGIYTLEELEQPSFIGLSFDSELSLRLYKSFLGRLPFKISFYLFSKFLQIYSTSFEADMERLIHKVVRFKSNIDFQNKFFLVKAVLGMR